MAFILSREAVTDSTSVDDDEDLLRDEGSHSRALLPRPPGAGLDAWKVRPEDDRACGGDASDESSSEAPPDASSEAGGVPGSGTSNRAVGSYLEMLLQRAETRSTPPSETRSWSKPGGIPCGCGNKCSSGAAMRDRR